MKIEYSNFTVETSLEEAPTTDNFFKYHIFVTPEGAEWAEIIHCSEVCLPHVQELMSGDESLALQAIKSILYNREQANRKLRGILDKQSTTV